MNHLKLRKPSSMRYLQHTVCSHYKDSGHVKVDEAMPETILALVYMALLTSARISHVLAYESVKCLLEAGYHDIKKLKQSTWEERTEVLTKGEYTRYGEKTATALEELADFINEQYGMWL